MLSYPYSLPYTCVTDISSLAFLMKSRGTIFGSSRSPPVSIDRQPSIAPIMLDALCDHLAEKPGLYVEETAIFLWDEFNMSHLASRNRTLNYEISTGISYLGFGHIILYLSMNLDVIKGSNMSELAGDTRRDTSPNVEIPSRPELPDTILYSQDGTILSIENLQASYYPTAHFSRPCHFCLIHFS